MATRKRAVSNGDFQRVGESGLDARKRISLAKALASRNGSVKKSKVKENGHLRYTIDMNEAGQILLTPQAIHPREVWFYRNPKAQATLRRAIRQAAEGKLHYLGSFAKYADDEID